MSHNRARQVGIIKKWEVTQGLSHPNGLIPSVIPLTIICGAPCSGKSTLARERAGALDVIIDLDHVAAELSGATPHAWNRKEWLAPALERRNELLRALARPDCGWTAAWFVVSAPQAEERRWWRARLAPAEVTVIETPRDVCLDRLFADPERNTNPVNRAFALRAIDHWWQSYTRDSRDAIWQARS